MSVRIQFDDPHTFYTNLDYISGKIILSLTSDENVSAVMVKLEGESRTALMRPPMHLQQQNLQLYSRRDNRQGQLASENHKILYKVIQVFPSTDGSSLGAAYTLRPGQHVYPFRFKLPFNNGCFEPHNQQMGPGSGFGGLGLSGLQQMQYRHVKKTLPPSLTGFPGEAEVRYYVKVTVQRPSLFKENRRSAIGFKFLPIEPPRAAPTTNEVFARRPFVFQAGLAPHARKSSMFKKNPTPLSDTAPKGEVDARLPQPAILTCNQPMPLRIILRKTNESAENVFIVSLQATLYGFTEIRAQDVTRTETSTWALMSMNGLSIPVGSPSDPVRKENVVDAQLWNQIPLPTTVTPSFITCNLTRRYDLEVRVGLGYGVIGEIQPQIVTLPLRFQVEVFSGIKPPADLLEAIAAQAQNQTQTSAPVLPARPQQPRPTAPADPLYPPQLGTPAAADAVDAPPSYEDAMADAIAPTGGPRGEYSGVTDVNAPSMDEKGAAPQYSAGHGHQAGPS